MDNPTRFIYDVPRMLADPAGGWVRWVDYEHLRTATELNHNTVVAQQAVYNEYINKLEEQLKRKTK